MIRKEPKLRPSMTWHDMELLIGAAEHYIQYSVTSNQVTLETVKLMETKKYLESFRPVDTGQSALAEFIAKYGSLPQPSIDTLINESAPVISEPKRYVSPHSISPLDMLDLTNDQKYDMIKLRNEVTYTEAEKLFMLNTGTMIMMKRASIKPVNTEDL